MICEIFAERPQEAVTIEDKRGETREQTQAETSAEQQAGRRYFYATSSSRTFGSHLLSGYTGLVIVILLSYHAFPEPT